MPENAKWIPGMPTDIPQGKRPDWDGDAWIFVDLPASIEPAPIPPIDACKNGAKFRLAQSDWSVLPDVNISNTAEFVAYRAALRQLVTNPVADPTWPIEPQPVWL